MKILRENMLIQFSLVSFVVLLFAVVLLVNPFNVLSNVQSWDGALRGTNLETGSTEFNLLGFALLFSGFLVLYGGLSFVIWHGWRTITRQKAQLQKINAELGQQVQEGNEQIQLIDEIAQIITSTTDIQKVYERFADELRRLIDFQRANVRLLCDDPNFYVLKYIFGEERSGHPRGIIKPLANTQLESVIKTGRTVNRHHIADKMEYPEDEEQLAIGLVSYITVPLRADGAVIGALTLRSDKPYAFGSKEQAILERLAGQIAPAIKNADLFEKANRAEERARKLSLAVETGPAGVMITDASGKIEYINPKFSRVTGYMEHEVIGQTPSILKSNLTSPQVYQDLWKTIGEGKEWTGELLNKKKSGEYYWSRDSIAPMFDSDHNVTHFVSIQEDITDRRVLEETNLLKTRELEALFEIAGILIWPESFEHRCDAVLEELARIGQADWVTLRVPEQDSLRLIASSGSSNRNSPSRTWLSKQSVNSYRAFEEGTPIVVNNYAATADPLPEAVEKGMASMAHLPIKFGGEAIGLISVVSKKVNHFTEERVRLLTAVADGLGSMLNSCRLNEEVLQLEKQFLEIQKIESMGRMAGGIAHDFNNLLTAILGYSQLAMSGVPTGSESGEHLQEIRRAAERASHLTKQLLAFSRNQVAELHLVDLNELILDMDKMLRRLIGEEFEFIVLPGQDLKAVKIDPNQFQQVLMNLTLNARDAMPDGGTIVVETSNVHKKGSPGSNEALPFGDYVQLKVSDNGEGMSEEVKSLIFEPFFTTKEVGKGTGLGLSTCYGIVKQNGGTISVESRLGHGTVFEVCFPATAEALPKAEPDADIGQETEQVSQSILVVEDETQVRQMISSMLKSQGYSVMEASNGLEALSLLETPSVRAPELLLTDVIMPKMSGIQLAKKVRVSYPGTKVLFTSGYTGTIDTQSALIDDMTDFIAKPYNPQDMKAKVRQLMEATT